MILISCKEKFPDHFINWSEYKKYLAYDVLTDSYFIATFWPKGFHNNDEECFYDIEFNILRDATHWSELPKPKKNQKNMKEDFEKNLASQIHDCIRLNLKLFHDKLGNYPIQVATWALVDLSMNHFIDMGIQKEKIMSLISEHYDTKIVSMKEQEILPKDYEP